MSVSDSSFEAIPTRDLDKNTMDPHNRATSCYYRVGGLVRRGQRDLAVEIIEAEIRSAQHEALLEAARLVLTGEPIEIARKLREMAERTIRPKR